MELEITWSRAVRVWWSYLWRCLIAFIAVSIAIGMILGVISVIIRLAMEGAMGIPVPVIRLYTQPLDFVIGLVVSAVPMKMILGKDFGEFRLVLLAKQTPTETVSTTGGSVKTAPNQGPQASHRWPSRF